MSQRTYLIVDDSATMRRIIKNSLEEIGSGEYLEAANGLEALDVLARQPRPTLIFMDWKMPELDGLATLKRIRAEESTRQIPVIMVTTESERDQVLTAVKAGANNFVVKPFKPGTLHEKVEAVLGPA